MSQDIIKEESSKILPSIRDTMVANAVAFLKNPKIIDSPLSQKRDFLLKKGFTEKEIEIAIEKANIKNLALSTLDLVSQHSNETRTKRWLNVGYSFIMFGIAMYAFYQIYEKYIKKKFFDQKSNKMAALEANLNELNSSLLNMQASLASVTQQLQVITRPDNHFDDKSQSIVLSDLKSEVMSIKSILLSRHQFPATPQVNPSIPQWQLETNEDNFEKKSTAEELHKENSEEAKKTDEGAESQEDWVHTSVVEQLSEGTDSSEAHSPDAAGDS